MSDTEKMSENMADQGATPMDLSVTTHNTSQPAGTAVSQPGTNTSQPSVTSLQMHHQKLGFCLPNNSGLALSVPGSLAQSVAGQSPSGITQNIQMARGGIPVLGTGFGTGQVVYPRVPHPAFPQAISISSALRHQQISLQRLQGKAQPVAVQRLPSGAFVPISSQQIVNVQRSSSPGKATALRPGIVTSVTSRQIISNSGISQPGQKPAAATIVNVSQAHQMGLRVPNHGGQQMTIQRVVNPLVAQQVSVASQPNFVQYITNSAMVSQQIAQNSANVGHLQAGQHVGTGFRSAAPVGTATIVGSPSHIGTATIVTGQPVSIQPRPAFPTLLSGTSSTGITLTVTSISPGPAAVQSSAPSSSPQVGSITSNQQMPQIIMPASSISQTQVLRGGIPVVLPRAALALAGRQQVFHNNVIPRLIQKPMVSPSANCGGQVTVQVPQIVSPIIKTTALLSNQTSAVVVCTSNSTKDSDVAPTTVPSAATTTTTVSTAAPVCTSTATTDQANVGSDPQTSAPSSISVSTSQSQDGCSSSHNLSSGASTDVTSSTITTQSSSAAFLKQTSETSAPVPTSRQTDPCTTLSVTTTTSQADTNVSHGTAESIKRESSTVDANTISSASASQSTPDVVVSTVTSPSSNTNVSVIAEKTSSSLVTTAATTSGSQVSSDSSVLPVTTVTQSSAASHSDSGEISEKVCITNRNVMSSSVALTNGNVESNMTVTVVSTSAKDTTVTTSAGTVSVLSTVGLQELGAAHANGEQASVVTSEKTGPGETDGTILTEGFIDSNLLEWCDGVGTLPGTDMKFKINEFGDLELVEEGSPHTENKTEVAGGDASQDNYKSLEGKRDFNDKKESRVMSVSDPSELSDHEGDPICCCVYCGCYGYKSNFRTSGRFCSQTCAGKKNLHRKQMIMSRMMMGMKNKKKKLIMSGEMKSVSQEDHNGSGGGSEKKLLNFDWDSYLAETSAVGAPRRLFKEPFPTSRNGFRLGMRLEGIDPKHQSLICVLSVAEIQGYRLRLHFDGYSECYDFWVNADSPFIFPAGWAEKNGKTLQPPKNIQEGEFNWTSYLKQTRAVAAPKHLFTNQPSVVTPSAFRVGMKLEAVDKKNSSLVCVASVADTLGDRILIHFDGWEDAYDYWCDIASPSIHPVGWCKSNSHTLSSPPDYGDNGNFTWEKYLADTRSTAVPARAFKTRGPLGFEKGMKVEVVDKRNPILVRVATIADVAEYRLLIHFDGWDSIYDYWIDDDSSDLHPPHWCSKTFHPLQSPIDKKSLKQMSDSGGCPTIGCKGIGHIKGAKYTGHHSAFGCPYSEVNMSKDSALTDRLGSSRSEEGGGLPARHDANADIRKCPTPGCDGLGHVTGKFTSHHCLSGCPLAERNLAKVKQENGGEPRPVGRPGRGRKRKIFSTSHASLDKVIKKEPIEGLSEERSALHASIHESVFQSSAVTPPPIDQPLCWEQHAKLLPGVMEVNQTVVANWTVEEVAEFVRRLTGNEEQAQKFREEQVDGDSFLLLQQSDLLNFLDIKLGPAIKIFNSILVFKAASDPF